MFTPATAMDALQSSQKARQAIREEDARRLTDRMTPWFAGLATYVDPFLVSPVPPRPMVHESNAAAYTWAVEVLPPGGAGGGRIAALMTTAFIDAEARTCFLFDFQAGAGAAPRAVDAVRRTVLEYAHETLTGEFALHQTTALYRGLAGGE